MGLPGLRTHRKFRRLVAILRIPEAHALGHLQMMWETSWDHLTPALGDSTDVELAAGWVGDPGALAAALVACGGDDWGFLERDGEGRFLIHDYEEHAPRWVRDKLRKRGELAAEGKTISDVKREAGRRGAAARWGGHVPPPDGKPAQVCQADDGKRMADDGKSCPSPPLPSPLKEQEEPNGSSCAAPDKPDAPPPSPVLYQVPCAGSGAKTWPLTQAKMDEWVEAFPGVDVPAELRKAIQWLKDNPNRSKTARGMPAFFGRWLGNAQDRNPGSKHHPTGAPHVSRSPAHRAEVDAAYADAIAQRPAQRVESVADDPELLSLFQGGARP